MSGHESIFVPHIILAGTFPSIVYRHTQSLIWGASFHDIDIFVHIKNSDGLTFVRYHKVMRVTTGQLCTSTEVHLPIDVSG